MSFVKIAKEALLSVSVAGILSVSVQASEPIHTVDVMVLYTSDLSNSVYGKDLDAQFASLEDFSNQTFKNSRVNLNMRIVHTEPVPEVFNTKIKDLLEPLKKSDTIAKLRKKHGADFVVVMGDMGQVGLCGRGMLLRGNPNTGKLYFNSHSEAFTVVDYKCGSTPFIHEIGHNMALGHSLIQGSIGGVWPWAIGYGKTGKWASTMAYDFFYSTRNRLQYFSNPDIKKCVGGYCGRKGKADASKSLNLLASQFSDFMPTIHGSQTSSSGGSSSSSGGSSSSSGGSTSTNNPLSNNFNNGLQGWKDGFGAVVKYEARGGVDATGGMSISKRNKQHQGARKDLKGLLASNTSYTLEADIFVDGKKREKFKPYLYRKIAGTNKVWIKIGSRTISPGSWQKVKMTMHVPNVSNADILDLYLMGPKKGVDIKFDNVRITKK